MKYYLTLVFSVFICFLNLNAQLPDGNFAPSWDVTDLNGMDHELEDYLDNGQHVIIDFSATWCPPCWSYHQSGVLEDLYEDLGPSGSNELMVFFFEGDSDSNDACLYGDINNCSDVTLGNWVFGTEYPIVNLQGGDLSLVNQYNISYWPTIYLINADHQTIWEVGQSGYNTWENWITESFTLEADFEVTPGPCELGEISISASGGFGNLTYTWSNGDTGSEVTVPSGYYDVSIEDNLGYFVVLDDIEIENDEAPFIIEDVEIIDVDCNGEDSGSIYVDIDSNDDLDYFWSNGDDDDFNANLESGTYFLTVVNNDNGCEIELEYEVEEPEPLEMDFETINTTCGSANGFIAIYVEGGVGDYYYDFGDGYINENEVQNLEAGVYEIYVEDENSCVTSVIVEIESSEALMTEIEIGMELSCVNTETLVEAAVNSMNAITYTWSNELGEVIQSDELSSIVINQAGNYILHTIDQEEGCESTTEFTITENYDVPDIEIEGIQDLDCETTSILVNLTLEDTMSIYITTWSYMDQNGDLIELESTSFNVLEPGLYDVTVENTINGCSIEASFEINYLDNTPIAAFDFSLDVDILNLISQSSGENLVEEWTVDGAMVNLDQDGNIFFDENGVYEVCLTTSNECGASTSCVTIEVTDIISNTNDLTREGFEIYNSGNILIINSPKDNLDRTLIRILDRSGKLVRGMKLDIQKGENAEYLPVLNTGIYFVNIQTAIGEQTFKMFVAN